MSIESIKNTVRNNALSMYSPSGFTCKEFGVIALETGDLDPVYNMLHEAGLTDEEMRRFLLAYWCFYHVGVASYCANVPNDEAFWSRMREAYHSKFPRGAERRYFRGEKSLRTIEWLEEKSQGNSCHWADWFASAGSFPELKKRVKTLPLFGDWIAFKIADMVDRVLGVYVDFSECHLDVYKDPVQGAFLLAYGDWRAPAIDQDHKHNVLVETVAVLEEEFSGYMAPPRNDRLVNLQEAETILCKYKSHFKGHYLIGKDSREVAEALDSARWGDLAGHLRGFVPGRRG